MHKDYNTVENYDADRGNDDRVGLPEIISESGASNDIASTAGNLNPRNREELLEFKESPDERRPSFGCLEVNPLSKRSLHNDLLLD